VHTRRAGIPVYVVTEAGGPPHGYPLCLRRLRVGSSAIGVFRHENSELQHDCVSCVSCSEIDSTVTHYCISDSIRLDLCGCFLEVTRCYSAQSAAAQERNMRALMLPGNTRCPKADFLPAHVTAAERGEAAEEKEADCEVVSG